MSDCCAPNANGADSCAIPNAATNTTADDCCAVTPTQTQTAGQTTCPVCGTKGKSVDTQIVKAMLDVSLATLKSDSYRFCRKESCQVVYFGDSGDVYTEDDLRERVHQKHPDAADVFVCYCFRHTPGSIQRELLLSGASTVVEQVNAGIQAGQCACEIRNPQGSCCLGNVAAAVKRAQKSFTPVAA